MAKNWQGDQSTPPLTPRPLPPLPYNEQSLIGLPILRWFSIKQDSFITFEDFSEFSDMHLTSRGPCN